MSYLWRELKPRKGKCKTCGLKSQWYDPDGFGRCAKCEPPSDPATKRLVKWLIERELKKAKGA